MVTLPRAVWQPGRRQPGEFHILAFDPGGTIGWSHLVLDYRAFSRPENKVLSNVRSWNSGEFQGTEVEQIQSCVDKIWVVHFGRELNARANVVSPAINAGNVDTVSEDFELTQLIGGKNLLSPVRINAVLDWECRRQGLQLHLQKRSMRTGVTKDRLKLFGFTGRRFGKDEFSAMQHAVVWLRGIKKKSIAFPWKLMDKMGGRYWDCDCSEGYQCDWKHP